MQSRGKMSGGDAVNTVTSGNAVCFLTGAGGFFYFKKFFEKRRFWVCISYPFVQMSEGTISIIMNAAGFGTPEQTTLPAEMVTTMEDCGFFESIPLWAVTLIGWLFITVLSFILIMTVYGRFFKLYMYTALMENISKKLFLCCWYFMAYNYEVNLCIIWKYIGEYVWHIKNWYVICVSILSCLNSKVRKILIISQAIHCEFRCCICYT